MYATYYGEISAQRAQINEAEKRFLLIIATAIGFGLVSAVAGAMWLARSVLVPLREFEKGMTHFANDNLTYRLDLKNNDEIGRLARDFNTMAESLMEHKARLEELSSRDGLTGLYNRREFEDPVARRDAAGATLQQALVGDAIGYRPLQERQRSLWTSGRR